MSGSDSSESDNNTTPDWFTSDVEELFLHAVSTYEECKNASQRERVIKDLKKSVIDALDDGEIECPRNLTQVFKKTALSKQNHMLIFR
jgi:hypothetical protein